MRDQTLKYVLVMPAVMVVFATAIWPLVESLRLSFTVGRLNRPGSLDQYLGWENFTWAFTQEPAFWNSVWVTGLYTFWTVGLTTLLALGLAMLLAPGGKLRSGVQTLLILPFAMSPALIGVSFRFMFNPEFGLFDAFFGVLIPPLADVSWLADPTLAFAVAIMADVWGWIPFLTLVLIGGLASVPKDTIEAAQVDGASGWRVFRDVTLPQLLPVLAVVIILKAIFSLKTFDQIYMLTNGGPGTATQTLSHYIYFNGMKYGQIGYAASVAWLMVIPMVFLTYLYAKFVFKKAGRHGSDQPIRGPGKGATTRQRADGQAEKTDQQRCSTGADLHCHVHHAGADPLDLHGSLQEPHRCVPVAAVLYADAGKLRRGFSGTLQSR
jgi:multiple sugar transport system permease protein